MTELELQQKINKAPVTPEGSRLIPYPHQDSGEFYPEYNKYGKLWEEAEHGDSAREHVQSYNRFVTKLKQMLAKNAK